MFRRIERSAGIGTPLSADAVSAIYRRFATFVGYSEKHVAGVSGHSIRLGPPRTCSP